MPQPGPPMSESKAAPTERTSVGGVDPAQTPYRLLFVLGAPRSGTTWVQLLLEKSPDVVTAPETQIFAYYLDHFRKQWKVEHTGPAAEHQGGAGLHRLLSEEEFLGLCAHSARYVLDRIWERDRSASVVLEKSPRHAIIADWIVEVFPDAHIVHVVRDPRDAAASIMEAGRSWGRGWAPTNPVDAGRLWKAHVEGARRAGRKTSRYREVTYEALRESAPTVLRDLLDWIGAPRDDDFCREAAEACSLDRLRRKAEADGASDSSEEIPVPGGRSPEGFFGRGAVGGWGDRMSRSSAACVEAVCYELMQNLGYQPRLASSARPTLRILVHDVLARIRDSIDWQLQRLLRHV